MLIRQYKSKSNRPSSAHLKLLAALLGVSVMLSGCGDNEHHEAHEVTEAADEAAELARENAPEAEVLEFDNADATPETTDTDAAETTTDAEATGTDVEAETEAEVVEEPAEAEAATAAADETVLAAGTGKEVYDKVCVACHETGLLNSPKRGDSDAWAPRIAKGKETLYDHSANGFNQMPAQAVNGVSKEEVAAAVDYLVAEAQ